MEKIFELDAANISRWEGIEGDRMLSGRVRIPASLDSRYRPHLPTRVVVYGQNHLQDYDCSLTIPQRLQGKVEGGENLQFHYQLGKNPRLKHEVMGWKTARPIGVEKNAGCPAFLRPYPVMAVSGICR